MVLFDTNVLIDYWRKPEELLRLNIAPDKFAICGAVRTELLHGARNNAEIDKMLSFFTAFKNLPNDDYDWEGVGFVLQSLQKNGFQIPLADAIIAFTAMKYDVPLWTRDKHFQILQAYYPELTLYEE